MVRACCARDRESFRGEGERARAARYVERRDGLLRIFLHGILHEADPFAGPIWPRHHEGSSQRRRLAEHVFEVLVGRLSGGYSCECIELCIDAIKSRLRCSFRRLRPKAYAISIIVLCVDETLNDKFRTKIVVPSSWSGMAIVHR